MDLFHYEIKFTNGDKFAFNTEADIDFHTLKPSYIAFNDMFINLTQINYISKEKVEEADNGRINKA